MTETNNQGRDFSQLAYAIGNQNWYFYNLFAQQYNDACNQSNPVQALSHLDYSTVRWLSDLLLII